MAPIAQAVSLSNQMDSPSGGDGYVVGQSGSKVGFYGTSPVVQPSDNSQAVLSRGQQAGVISTYHSAQTPSAVAANTSAEQALVIQTGTGAQMLIASGDVVYLNKPTSQAGLAYGNVRVSGSNSLGVTYHNVTTGSITPTATENYSLVALRGVPKISATLSPSAVAANTAIEQQFSVVGLPAGYLVQVNKPTAQAGLDIVGCRVVSSNVLGITFCNVTASPITPTASESYTVFALAGLDAIGNEIDYGFNVGTVGACGVGVVLSGGNSVLTGMLSTDMVAGIFKPTAQAAATNNAIPAYALPVANSINLYFFGVGTGITPTASEVYGIRTIRMNPVAPMVLYSASISPGSVAANTSAEQTFTVTGLVSGSPVWVNKPSATLGIGIGGCRVSASNTLAINFVNYTSTAIVPPSESYLVGNFQVASPGAGNCVYQHVSPVVNGLGNLCSAERAAMVSQGLIAGA